MKRDVLRRALRKILTKYRQSVIDNPGVDFQDFAAEDILALLKARSWKSPEEIKLMYNPDYLDFQKGCEVTRELCKKEVEQAKQAGYKLGKEDGLALMDVPAGIVLARRNGIRAGRREVMEWVETESEKAYICNGEYTYDTKYDNQLFLDLGDWQSKLKEWQALKQKEESQ